MRVIHHESGKDPLYKTWHFTDAMMILYVYSEGGSIVFRDGIYPLKKGSLCMVSPGIQMYTVPEDPALYDRSKIFVSKDTVKDLLRLLPTAGSSHRLLSDNAVLYAQIPPQQQEGVEQLYVQAQEGITQDAPELFFSSLLQLMNHLKNHLCKQIHMPDDFVSRTLGYINTHYEEAITLDLVCRDLHVSKYHLCHRFKKVTGMTIMDYLLKTRIAAAKEMLLSDGLPIGAIASACGFSSAAYFCQAFRQHTGQSAGQFRKEGRYL